MNSKIYDIINSKIEKQLEAGVNPWERPWNVELPQNIVSKKVYHGINFFLLAYFTPFKSPFWLTFKQANALGGKIKKGEHGTEIVYWTLLETGEKTKTGKDKVVPLLRYYRVWNLEQTEGIKAPNTKQHFEPVKSAEKVVKNYKDKPKINFGSSEAFFSHKTDEITLPNKEDFKSIGDYYSTLFHELVHSTGHKSRLNRYDYKKTQSLGDANYAQEELVAEIGNAYLCAFTGIKARRKDDHASYIASWLKALKNDKKFFFTGAKNAQIATMYMFNGKDYKDIEERLA